MSGTDYDRNHLFAWFEEHMGKERAATMMNLLPPVGWGDVATRRDLDGLDSKIDRVVERFDTKYDALDATIDLVAERTDARIDASTAAIRADLAELRSDLQRTFATWMFAAQGAVVAAIGLLLVVVR